jgi:excinuclease UvrABC nuclease subunit
VLDLDCGVEFDAARDEDFFAALPARPGVYLIEPRAAGAQPYLSRTVDLRRAAERLLRQREKITKRLNLRDVAAGIRFRLTGSRLEQSLALYHQARARFPKTYRDFLRLRPPAVLKVNLRNAYPRAYVTRRISADDAFYAGPFASRRSAEFFAEGFRDLFKVRRCQIKIRRDPGFPGCIYSEMKMCLAPCFAGCTPEGYQAELARSLQALATAGTSLEASLGAEREAASEALDFERAAAIHKKIEKAASAFKALPELARPIESLDLVILQRAAEENAVMFFPVIAGIFAEPFVLRFGDMSQPRSAEAALREHLENVGSPSLQLKDAAASDSSDSDAADVGDLRKRYGLRHIPPGLSENLSILARWFYSKPREGEIFFRDREWPYRRLLRACARLLNPTPPPPEAPPAPNVAS